jgi:hypothetical protein
MNLYFKTMDKQNLKNRITDLLDYYFPEIDSKEMPAALIILDALKEVREEILEEHFEFFESLKDENSQNS